MHSEKSAIYLSDIRKYTALALEYTSHHSAREFENDTKSFLAVTRCLEIISEAARKLPEAMVSRHQHIPWKAIKAAGNVYRHDYGSVIEERVYFTVKDHLPQLLQVIEAELAMMRPDQT